MAGQLQILDDTEAAMMPKVVTLLSSVLQRISDSNDGSAAVEEEKGAAEAAVSAFHGLTRPAISVHSYLARIFKYANCSPSCFVVAYVYLDRFVQLWPGTAVINSFSVHRLLITSVLVSAKFMDDRCYDNAYYAKVGGISTAEMNLLELDFLFGLSFHLNVTPTTFYTYCSYLQTNSPLNSPKLPPLKMVDRALVKRLQYCCFSEDECTHQQAQQLAV